MAKRIILIVDDEEDILKVLEMRLESEGYEVICAKDGVEMLESLKIKRPDCIVLDIMMPRMDGYTALREMRKDDKLKDIPVIILTAKEEQKMSELFVFEKIAFFVEKPYAAKDLVQKVRSVLHE